MKKFTLLLWLCAFTAVHTQAHNACAEQKKQRYRQLSTAKSAIASPLLELYDVIHLKLDLSMSHLNTSIGGNAITTAKVIAPGGMGSYAFELNDNLAIDSIKMNGISLAWTSPQTNVHTVALPVALPAGAIFTAQVFYHGASQNGTGFFTHGLNHYALPSGTNITFSLSDPDLAKDWWPAKQSLTDKIDSADLWFTVPAATMAGSNGLLMATTPQGSNTRYEWRTRYPIEYYLISVAIAPYTERKQMLYFSGTDSMPVQHFLYDAASLQPQQIATVDSTPQIIDYFSTLFTRYPFWKEKYGHCIAPLQGGMEHQTMTTLGYYQTTLIAHELGHQWWGDHVTYASWRDIWLSEGFAAYCEQLFVERFHGAAAMQAYRRPVHSRVMSRPDGSVYVDDTNDVYRIFSSRLTYDKGAAVAHMLRYIAPSDAAYFNGLKAYQQRYAFGLATTDSFKAIMETAYGRKLDTFFNQWVYGQGYPRYTPTYNQKNEDVYVQLSQTTSHSSVPAFALPVILQLRSATKDTLVKVYLSTASALYYFKWSETVTGITIDPTDEIVNAINPAVYDPKLGVEKPATGMLHIAPNPTGAAWQVSGLSAGSDLALLDMAGKTVWKQKNAPAATAIDARGLPAGIYTLRIQHNSDAPKCFKLERL